MNKKIIWDAIKRYDFSFFGAASAIFLIGIINLYSATHTSNTINDLYKGQIGLFFLAMGVGAVVSFIRPKNFFILSYPVYFGVLGILILVLLVGDVGMGARRWLAFGGFRLQPSELMKIAVILALARWFSKVNPEYELGLKDLIIPFILAFVPALLIILQPDLGTGMLVLLIFFMVAFYRRLKWKTIGIILVVGMISSVVMYEFGLKEYQRKRILTFINPDEDARGSGYNAIQSKIAIGSGKFFGKGFRKSSQASLNYLPENQTDFVFSIFNEEHGFFGSLVLIVLYLVFLLRFMKLAASVTRFYESIVVIGLMSIFFWHTFINMSMVMGLVPIVGVPLPFMSYGGSSLMTFGICCGIATSISNSRNLF